jgi:hypothetical protein
MRASLVFLFVAAALTASQPAAAQDNEAYAQWIKTLVSTHLNREFCPPPGTTYGAMGKDMGNYIASHPAQKKDMTDAEWLKLLGTIYPCKQPTMLSADQAAALGTKPLGTVGGNYTVRLTGIYSTIDMARSTVLLNALRGPPSQEVERQITLIQARSGDYIPPVLMQMANDLFNAGKTKDAIFWFHAGLLRTILDVRLSTDPSVADAPKLMVRKAPLELVKAAISNDPNAVKAVQDVVTWDAKTPYNYDHRWVALHGIGATQSALDPTHAPTALTKPDSQWPTIIANNRAAYADFVSGNAARVKAAQN